MSTFGEIVEPVSRTAWEDWDEIAPENNYAELQWRNKFESVEPAESFLIFEGKYLSDIITMQSQTKLQLINSISEINLHIFRVKNLYVCVVKDYNLVLSSEIVELLKPYLASCADVIAIQTKPMAVYQYTEMLNEDCLIRSITTTKASAKIPDLNYPKLEQPNIITGVTAGVICLREFQGLNGQAIVCYIEHPEEYLIDGIQNLLKKLNIIQNTTPRPNTVLSSNLYI